MKPALLYLICLFFLGSCATILDKRYKSFEIYTSLPAKLVFNKDTIIQSSTTTKL